MGAPKVKCPGCGAKNDAHAHRCRVCTTIINMVKADETPAPVARPPVDDHFDMNALDQQMRPAASAFKSEKGGLGARLAAARGNAPAPAQPAPAPMAPLAPYAPAAPAPPAAFSSAPETEERYGPTRDGFDAPAPDSWAAEPRPTPPVPSPAPYAPAPDRGPAMDQSEGISFGPPPGPANAPPPIEYEEEKFDPNALFGDGESKRESF